MDREFDGPRLIRPAELPASRRLSRICFEDLADASADATPLSGDLRPEETYGFACQGQPVSQISIFYTSLRVYDGTVRVGSIGGVCTHPEYRGFGLASRLMEYCTRQLVQGGASLMLISGERGLYTRLGNVLAGKYASFTLRPGQRIPSPASISLRPVHPSAAALCSRMYQAEPIHFTRAMATYQEAFQPHPLGYHAEQWLVELEGRPAAYLLLSVPWEYVGQPQAGVRRVLEYAGSRAALVGALAAPLAQPGICEIQIQVGWQDTDFIHLLRQGGREPAWSALPEHTMRIINFPRLMAGLRPVLQASLSQSQRRGLRFEQTGPLLAGSGKDCCTITRGRDRLELSTAAMTNLVMGSPDDTEGDIAPGASMAVPGALADILPALFPLPSFLPGLDYH